MFKKLRLKVLNALKRVFFFTNQLKTNYVGKPSMNINCVWSELYSIISFYLSLNYFTTRFLDQKKNSFGKDLKTINSRLLDN